MTKFFCDRCGKESKKLSSIAIPVGKIESGCSRSVAYELCKECERDANEKFEILLDIRLAMFANFMGKDGGETHG